jgi:HAD superfamily hydrolase (TIGR01509 family)
MEAGAYDVVVFDVGGVLAHLGGVDSMRQLSGIEDDHELWRRWLTCPWVRRFERGECAPEDFASGVVADWGLSVTPERYLEEFARWSVGPLPGAEELLGSVRRQLPVACLSNTNVVHWQAGMASWPLMGLFDHCFLSFEMGMLKPDRDVFEHVCGRLGSTPSRTLFLDDNLMNVRAAASVGLRAIHVNGVAEARRALVAHGLHLGA